MKKNFLSDYADWFITNYPKQKERQSRERSLNQRNMDYELDESRRELETESRKRRLVQKFSAEYKRQRILKRSKGIINTKAERGYGAV